MADSLTGLTEAAGTIEALVSAEVQLVLNANVVMPGLISDYSGLAVPGADRVSIPRFGKFTVGTKSENTAVDAQVNTFAGDALLLDKHKVIQVLVEDIADLQSKVNMTQAYVGQMAMDLAVEMDQTLIDTLEAGVSTSSPDHKVAYAGATIAKADILTARGLLNVQNVPLPDRAAVIHPDQEAALLAISEFVRIDESGGSEALRNGRIGKLFGFDFYVSSLAESAKSMFFHKSAMAFARQMSPRVLTFKDVPNLATRYSIDHLYGVKVLDSGKRQVLCGTA